MGDDFRVLSLPIINIPINTIFNYNFINKVPSIEILPSVLPNNNFASSFLENLVFLLPQTAQFGKTITFPLCDTLFYK